MAGADTTLTLTPRSGEPLRLRFDSARLTDAPARGDDAPASAWSVDADVDWGEVELLRLLAGAFEDGRELAVAALRPPGADGHDAETIASRLVREGEPVEVEETLLSTEYDDAGLPRRLGLELWIDRDSPPLRVAADREGETRSASNGRRREVTPLSLRLEGVSGTGTYEVLRAG